MIRKWHARILADCRTRLGRAPTPEERRFVCSREGCVALEMIHDTVRSLEGVALAEYLNSEAGCD